MPDQSVDDDVEAIIRAILEAFEGRIRWYVRHGSTACWDQLIDLAAMDVSERLDDLAERSLERGEPSFADLHDMLRQDIVPMVARRLRRSR